MSGAAAFGTTVYDCAPEYLSTYNAGIAHDENGFTAMTLSQSRTFRTAAGAIKWLAARGYDAHGKKIR